MQRRTETVISSTLFDVKRQSEPTTVQVRCSGCAATATVQVRRTITAPTGWIECGQTPERAIALWCAQCGFEGKHDAHALQHYRQWMAERDDLEAS
jgi:hypothetical protein